MYKPQDILQLSELRGGWASRALFEQLVSQNIDKKRLSISDIDKIIQRSSGESAMGIANKITKIFGVTTKNVTQQLDTNVTTPLPIIQDYDGLPTYLDINFWLDELQKLLDCRGNAIQYHLDLVRNLDNNTSIDNLKLVKEWSFPLIGKLHSIPNDQPFTVRCVVDDIANFCWRRWYWSENKEKLYLIVPPKKIIGNSQWLMFTLVHDASHLFHLTVQPNTCKPENPIGLAFMEGFAMATELRMYEYFKDGYVFEKGLLSCFDTYSTKVFNVLGLLERAFRLNYDAKVHLEGWLPEKWVRWCTRKYGFNETFLKFAYEFHGLPGLASCYMLGMLVFHNQDDRQLFLKDGLSDYSRLLNQIANPR
jgi:hypothetical protein